MPEIRPVRRIVIVAFLLASVTLPALLSAQESRPPLAQSLTVRPQISIGYIANAPELFIGGGLAYLTPSFVGVFADFRISESSPGDRSDFMPDWTINDAINEFGDFSFGRESRWVVANAGVTRVLLPDLAAYVGAGYASRTAYEQFQDQSGERGERGFYWVEDHELSGTYLNLLGGVYFRAGRNLMFQLGAEAQPRGMTIGAHYVIPFGG